VNMECDTLDIKAILSIASERDVFTCARGTICLEGNPQIISKGENIVFIQLDIQKDQIVLSTILDYYMLNCF